MKFGILSDIHGNLEALEIVLEEIKKEDCNEIIFLGDIVGYGANPNECIELLRKERVVGVAGNHDYAVLNKTSIENFNPYAKAAILWTQKVLTKESLWYLDAFLLVNKSYPFHIVHSSPDDPSDWYYLFTIEDIIPQFNFFNYPVCLVGHTHMPFIVAKRNDGKIEITKENKIELNPDWQYIINVGSVGQPRDKNPKACFAIYDTKKNIFEIRRVDYDIKKAADKIIKANLPSILAERLFYGQ
ncbi:MAG: metallophosphoesterase family protein [candidate division WOR-3 bacterium]